jgi:hypothetical protein
LRYYLDIKQWLYSRIDPDAAASFVRRVSMLQTHALPLDRGFGEERVVNSVQDLVRATSDPGVQTITIAEDLNSVPEIRLSPGTTLRGHRDRTPVLRFAEGNGVCLTSDNLVENLGLLVSPDRLAIRNDECVASLGTLTLQSISTVGRVRLLARGAIRGGHVEVENLDIIAADARSEKERPHEYGVYVVQGAFTLWNMQSDPNVVITSNLVGLSAGRMGAPVLGSGMFVSGAGDTGGRLRVQHLETNAAYSDGRIEPGTADQISGGVFVVHGATVELVVNRGPVTTYGANDMALDNWGDVDRWISKDKVTTFGPSGVGFVNFGRIDELVIHAPIETFGVGARGFNVYTGTIRRGDFDRIVTHADGAVGVQISQPVGRLIFRRGIETHGAIGQSLVKGVLQNLPATALSIKPGGSAQEIRVLGGLRSHGKDVAPLEQHGEIETLHIEGGFSSATASPNNS